MIKKLSIISAAVLLQIIQIYPQTPPYYHYESSDGLASSTVFDVIQDKEGFIWFGTLNGLSRFDGKNFITFRAEDGLNSNVITSLVEGEKGEMYIGNYEKGINIMKDGRIINFRGRIRGKNFNTTYLLNTPDYLFAVTRYGSLNVIRKNSAGGGQDFVVSTAPYSLNRVAELSDSILAVLTSGGIFKLNGKSIERMNFAGLPDTRFYSLARRGDGSIFIGGMGIIYKIAGNKVIKKITMSNYEKNIVNKIYCDKSNDIWFSILGKGFFVIPFDTEKIINFGSKLGLGNTAVDGFMEDNEGNIWITTFGKGAFCLNNRYLRNFTENDGLVNNNIICLEKVKPDKILIGTISGISILEDDRIVNLRDSEGEVISSYVNQIKKFGDIICVCWAPETPEIKKLSFEGMRFRFIRNPSICKTNHDLYIYGGIGNDIRISKEITTAQSGWTLYPIAGDTLYQNRVNALAADKNNNIWVGTSGGLCKLNFIKDSTSRLSFVRKFFKNNRVLSSKINSIYVDNKDNVWFTGVKGLAKYNPENDSIISYTKIGEHILLTPTSVVSDNQNRIWIGTMAGLYLMDGDSSKFLNRQTGLPSNEVLSLCYDGEKNLLYIGTSNGLSLLDVNLFDSYKHSSLSVNINSVKAGDSLYSGYEHLVFKPEQNDVYINFIALNYSSPASVKYKYILNSDTSETVNNFLDFSSLKYGTYKLQIRAKAANMDWGKPVFLQFRILPRFTETIWFPFMIILGLAIIAIVIFVKRLKQNNKKNIEQLELTERINSLKHQALSAMMNPHFIFNSLNSVQYLVNSSMLEEANNYIAMMAKLIRMNLDTAGNAFVPLNEEIDRLRLYLDLEKMRFRDKFSYNIITGKNLDVDSVLIPNMILQPFVENSLWHGIMDAGVKGILKVTFLFEEIEIDGEISKALIIKVMDNGIGINEAKKNKKEDHISKGIQIIEERLSLLSSKMQLPKPILFEDLSIRNKDSHGTEVIISLPEPMYKIVDPSSYTPNLLTD